MFDFLIVGNGEWRERLRLAHIDRFLVCYRCHIALGHDGCEKEKWPICAKMSQWMFILQRSCSNINPGVFN